MVKVIGTGQSHLQAPFRARQLSTPTTMRAPCSKAHFTHVHAKRFRHARYAVTNGREADLCPHVCVMFRAFAVTVCTISTQSKLAMQAACTILSIAQVQAHEWSCTQLRSTQSSCFDLLWQCTRSVTLVHCGCRQGGGRDQFGPADVRRRSAPRLCTLLMSRGMRVQSNWYVHTHVSIVGDAGRIAVCMSPFRASA